jgi:hypothetical protein
MIPGTIPIHLTFIMNLDCTSTCTSDLGGTPIIVPGDMWYYILVIIMIIGRFMPGSISGIVIHIMPIITRFTTQSTIRYIIRFILIMEAVAIITAHPKITRSGSGTAGSKIQIEGLSVEILDPKIPVPSGKIPTLNDES